jgi:hypothetical protein
LRMVFATAGITPKVLAASERGATQRRLSQLPLTAR